MLGSTKTGFRLFARTAFSAAIYEHDDIITSEFFAKFKHFNERNSASYPLLTPIAYLEFKKLAKLYSKFFKCFPRI